jgi:hypothetical protein
MDIHINTHPCMEKNVDGAERHGLSGMRKSSGGMGPLSPSVAQSTLK